MLLICHLKIPLYSWPFDHTSRLNYLRRLRFAFKRPKKQLLKADEAKRESFAAEYGTLWDEAERTGGKIYFADESHFRADAELRGKRVPKGTQALAHSNSPRYGQKASYYSAVCFEAGKVEWMELEGKSNSGASPVSLNQLRQRHSEQLNGIWDNAPANRGAAVREYRRTPGPELRLVNLPDYSPDVNADEASWRWVREAATGNLCLGSRANVQEMACSFLAGLACSKEDMKRRCRTVLQSRANALMPDCHTYSQNPRNAHPTLALV